MKLTSALQIWVLMLLAIVNLQAQTREQYDEFYKKAQGLYQDPKTNEVVFFPRQSPNIFYQSHPYVLNSQVKVMRLISLDVPNNQIQLQFAKSNYRCAFFFAKNYQSFTCLNPDGSRQIFQKVQHVIKKPFSYFLALFGQPFKGRSYRVPPRPVYTQELPLQVAWEFLDSRSFKDEYPVPSEHAAMIQFQLYRLFSSTPQVGHPDYAGCNTHYLVKRLSLHPNFYSLLVRQKGFANTGETNYDITILYNFNQQGQLIAYKKVAGVHIEMQSAEFHTISIIKGLKLQVQDLHYKGLYAKGKTPKVYTYNYTISPTGKFKPAQ